VRTHAHDAAGAARSVPSPDETRVSILTVTPNPSLDLLFTAGRLLFDDANRVEPPRRRAGGQGINVARAAHALGGSCVPVAQLGGRTGDELVDMLRAENAGLVSVPIVGETRVFVGVRTADGHNLLLNPRGPVCDDADADRLRAATRDAIRRFRPHWVACCGSLPPGFDDAFYAAIAEDARADGAAFVADCDGAPLRNAARACDLLVPNAHEAARLLDTPVASIDEAAEAARGLLDFGARVGVVTLGELGAVAASRDGCWHAVAPFRGVQADGNIGAPQTHVTSGEAAAGVLNATGSAVGAGDGFLAALLMRIDAAPLPDALRFAVAAGSAVLESTGAAILDRAAVVRLERQVEVGALHR
jgi:1-phosphofructokinase family hexose kinase